MPVEIVQLFEYLYWVRDRCLIQAAALGAEAFLDPTTVAYRDLRASLVHELDVERSWRLRLQGAPRSAWDVDLDPTAYPDVASLVGDWQDEEGATLEWLADLSDADLATAVTANGLEGFPLSTYLVHLVMHGIESFSAVAILLHRAGKSVGDVGYLDFIDTQEARAAAPRSN